MKKKKRLLHLSFKDSTKVVLDRFWLSNGRLNDKKISSFNMEYIYRLIGVFIFICGFGLVAYSFGRLGFITNPKAKTFSDLDLKSSIIAINISSFIRPLLNIVTGLDIFAGIAVLFPSKNFAKMRLREYIFWIFIYLQLSIGFLPYGSALAHFFWGPIPMIMSLLWFPIWVFMNLYNSYITKLKKLENIKVKQFPLLKILLVVLLFCIILGVFCGNLRSSKFIYGGFLFLVYTIAGPVLTLFANAIFTVYYLLKYSDQYRVYYKITDAAWWLSSRRAKKHKRVYSIPKAEEIDDEKDST